MVECYRYRYMYESSSKSLYGYEAQTTYHYLVLSRISGISIRNWYYFKVAALVWISMVSVLVSVSVKVWGYLWKNTQWWFLVFLLDYWIFGILYIYRLLKFRISWGLLDLFQSYQHFSPIPHFYKKVFEIQRSS